MLTPDAAGTGILMPTDGSTMSVFIDGVSVGTVAYNQCRGTVGNPVPAGVFCNDDVADIFGNATPQAAFTRATEMRRSIGIWTRGARRSGRSRSTRRRSANGSHSLAWGVTDSAGRVEGIGSRNFVVLNSGADVALADQLQTSNFELRTSERTDTVNGRSTRLAAAPAIARGGAASLAGLPVATGAGLGTDGLRSGDGAGAGAG